MTASASDLRTPPEHPDAPEHPESVVPPSVVPVAVPADSAPADSPGAGTSDVAALYRDLVRITRSLRAVGPGTLSAGTASALWSIINHGPLRLSELAERESVTMPTVSRIVASLEQQGYVERAPDPTDGRARQLIATTAGAEYINLARSAKAQILSSATMRLDPRTRQQLHDGVAALADAIVDTPPQTHPSHKADLESREL